MNFRSVNKLSVAISALLLASSQVNLAHAADSDYSGIAAPPRFTPSTGSYPPPPPGGWEGVVDSIDKQIESDQQALESARPGTEAPVAAGPQPYTRSGFPEFQDPPEWGQREVPTPPEWGSSAFPTPPEWADRDAPQQPAWAKPDTPEQQQWAEPEMHTPPEWGSSGFPAPPEWGGGSMPEPPEWGDRDIPKPPQWADSGRPQQPQWAGSGAQQQPQWSRQIPDPPEWNRGMPSYGPPGYSRGPTRPAYRDPWSRSRGPGYRSPWDSGPRGRDRDFSPFGSSGPSFTSPWDSGRGGRGMPWSSKKGRGGWMDKDKFGDAWDDMLNAPSDMGELPGGWYAPSVSVPNPVDVGDEFGTAAEDMPTQMRNVYDDNRRSNTYDRYDRYDRYDPYRR